VVAPAANPVGAGKVEPPTGAGLVEDELLDVAGVVVDELLDVAGVVVDELTIAGDVVDWHRDSPSQSFSSATVDARTATNFFAAARCCKTSAARACRAVM